MKGFLKLLCLVVVLVPVWITFLTFTGKERLKPTGALVAVEQALQNSEKELGVSGILRMDAGVQSDAWRLVGLTSAAPEQKSELSGRPFVAEMHTQCSQISEAKCWAVDRLDFPVIADASTDAIARATDPGEEAEVRRLLLVQGQLTEIGFDPGTPDGVMGPRTEQAIKDYVAQTEPVVTDDLMAQALIDLENLARLERASAHHAQGDYHSAIGEYSKVARLDPSNRGVHFNRAVIYQQIGVPDLAITEYDMTLELGHNHVMAYHGRGNAHFSKGEYWRAFADHADGFGLRLLGDRYIALKDRLNDAKERVAPEFEAMVQWAKGSWDQAKQAVAEKMRSLDEGDQEEAT
jgi:tetratricopeptide (TPR) repeat protein